MFGRDRVSINRKRLIASRRRTKAPRNAQTAPPTQPPRNTDGGGRCRPHGDETTPQPGPIQQPSRPGVAAIAATAPPPARIKPPTAPTPQTDSVEPPGNNEEEFMVIDDELSRPLNPSLG